MMPNAVFLFFPRRTSNTLYFPGYRPAPGFPQPQLAEAAGARSAGSRSSDGRSSGDWAAPARRMSAGQSGYIPSAKERERMTLANPDPAGPSGVFVHEDAGEAPGEIPPTYDSIRRD
ncbi:hypothetical protein BD626DRAFT_482822 [Schizophyllum amplum]|uniref:Uncharacterized protein n=1 Tax=Schizophyllum amplum TaxID=97359 RepID=A0A550CP17_9AGAR|nr:hypothetical protein BD626DRAFT_482822 [Auriculariopsis ampla]